MKEDKQSVMVKEGRPVTTSLILAASFDKEHKHVMRHIRNIECSEGFRESNFGLTTYIYTDCG